MNMIYAIMLQDLMKRGVCRCGVEMPLGELEGAFSKRTEDIIHTSKVPLQKQ
jgi:hypothetical protein